MRSNPASGSVPPSASRSPRRQSSTVPKMSKVISAIDIGCPVWHGVSRAPANEVLPDLRGPARRPRVGGPAAPGLHQRGLRLRVLRQSGAGGGGPGRARRDGAAGAQQGLAGEVVRARLRLSREGRVAGEGRAPRGEGGGGPARRD